MKRFVIMGGHTSNKGAQAMVFAVVQYLTEKYPDSEIWMFSFQDEDDSLGFNFNALNWDNRLIKRLLLGKVKYFTKPSKNIENEKKVEELLMSSDTVLDVSGYAFSSQWGFGKSLNYLLRIALMKKLGVKLILLPQSFGPFNFSRTSHQQILNVLMKRYLKYPVAIFPREQQGYDDLKHFTSSNLYNSLDIVLQTSKPSKEVVFATHLASELSKDLKIAENSVAIVPNSKILKWNNNNNIYELYKKIIEKLCESGYQVYILQHTVEDLDFCQQIYNNSSHEKSNIHMLIDDYTCIELHEIISKMEFIVASRYHSLVHAYKSGVPALVIGWAEKYRELMRHFNQQQYNFDIRDELNENNIIKSLDELLDNCSIERNKIINFVDEINNRDNALDMAFKLIR